MLNFVHQNLSSIVYIMHNLNVKPCSLLTHEDCLFFSLFVFFIENLLRWYIYFIYIRDIYTRAYTLYGWVKIHFIEKFQIKYSDLQIVKKSLWKLLI